MPGPRFGKFAGLRAKGSKFGNIKVALDGYIFASKREAAVYQQYKLLEQAGQITQLQVHPVYKLIVNGTKVGKVTPDLQFREADGKLRILDVKSPSTAKTEAFRLRSRLFSAVYPGLTIEVVY